MIQFTAHMRILVATQALDMRKGIDGIAALCRLSFRENPMSGAVFLFISRSRKHLRILTYDGQGFLVATKRLSAGRFPHWPRPGGEGAFIRKLEACQAQLLLQGGNPEHVRTLKPWKKIEESPAFLAGVA
jgi:transposase